MRMPVLDKNFYPMIKALNDFDAVVKQNGKRVDDLDQIHIPDPIAMELCKMQIQIDKLNKKIQTLEEEKK